MIYSISITGDSKTRLDYQPLYFVRSGRIDLTTGSLRYSGRGGGYWSSTAHPGSSTAAYNLDFNTADVYPSYRSNRYGGLAGRQVTILYNISVDEIGEHQSFFEVQLASEPDEQAAQTIYSESVNR